MNKPASQNTASIETPGFTGEQHIEKLVAKVRRKRASDPAKVAKATLAIVEALRPFDPETQVRILKAACALLDIPWPPQ